MKKVFIAGGFIDEIDSKIPITEQREFAKLLGKEVIKQGHILNNACKTEFDFEVANGANDAWNEMKIIPDKSIKSYVLVDQEPIHNFGDVKNSQLRSWDLNETELYYPEPIKFSDVVILVGGFEGTKRAANWARLKNKPLLPVTKLKGISEQIYYKELEDFDERYSNRINQEDFEDLNQRNNTFEELAHRVITLAELITTPISAFVIMSFKNKPELEDVFDSYKSICKDFKYNCIRMDNEIQAQHIIIEMLKHIDKSAFTIVDISEPSHNVYFELGYAHGQKKDFIITAKTGTNIPFDIRGLQILFWNNQRELREGLKTRIEVIAKKQGRN